MTRDFLKGLGIEDKEVIDQIMQANGEAVENAKKSEQKAFAAEKEQLSGQISQLQAQADKRDGDLKKLQEKLTAANEDSAKVADAQKALTDFQAQYETEKKDWAAQMKKQAYEFAVKTETGKLTFSSAAAQRDFTRGAIEADLKMDGDTLLGWTDFVDKYKETDPDAFKAEDPASADPDPAPAPAAVVAPTSNGSSGSGNPFSFNFQEVN